MMGRHGIEGMWFTHPLGHEPLPAGICQDPVVSRALVLRPRRHDHPLAMQRMIGIGNYNFLDVMMGSMECRRSGGRSRC
jgi:hypothetical protein